MMHMSDHAITTAEGDHIPPLPRVTIQAFCETSEIKNLINATQTDRRMAKTMLKVQDGGIVACLEAYRGAPTPNVIMIEAGADKRVLLSSLDELAQYCDLGTRVLVIGHTNDVLLYRDLMKRGVSEYLIAPIGMMDLIGALASMFNSEDGKTLGRNIVVMGAKGGVGASTIAHNLAFSISTDFDSATTLVDMDLPFGTAGLDFNQDPAQGIADVVSSADRLDANLVDRLLAKCTNNLNLMAAPATLDQTFDFRETDFDNLSDILRNAAPNIVYDMPHMWTSWSRRMLISADEVIIVAAPDLANLRNAKNLIDTLKQARPTDGKPLLVLNMVGVPKRPEIGAAEFAKALDSEIVAAFAFDPALFGTASNNGQMLVEVQAKSKTVDGITELARRVTGRSEAKIGKKSFLEPLLMRFKPKAA
jgi:pilus assembly protein CpaE